MSVLFDEDVIIENYVEEIRRQAEARVKAETRQSERQAFARAMLADGEPRAKILKFSRLTEEELDKLL